MTTKPLDFAKRHPFMFLPAAVYLLTVSHHIGTPDSAIIIDAMRDHVVSSNVCSHNINNLVGFLFNMLLPLSNIALKSNMVSVLYGTAAVGLFYLVLVELGLRRLLAALCAAIFMVSHSMWWHSTQVESYALNAAFLGACLLMALKDACVAEAGGTTPRYFLAMVFLAALSLFNHVQNGVLLLACAANFVVNIGRFRGRAVRVAASASVAALAGLFPYLAVLTHDLLAGDNWRATLHWAVGGNFSELMFHYDLRQIVARFADLMVLQFPSPYLLFIVAGVLLSLIGCRFGLPSDLKRRNALAFIWTVLVVNTGFFMGYNTWDQFAFYLPTFECLALLGALAANIPFSFKNEPRITLMTRIRDGFLRSFPVSAIRVIRGSVLLFLLMSCVALPPLVYPNIRRWAATSDGYWSARWRPVIEASGSRYDLCGLLTDPIFHDRGTVEQYVMRLFDKLPADALLVNDISTHHQAVYFQKYYGNRPDLDLRLVQPAGFTNWGTPMEKLVLDILSARGRVFVELQTGSCGELTRALAAYRLVPVPFPLAEGESVWEIHTER